MPLVGVDLGGTKILARMVDPETGHAWGRSKQQTPRTNPDEILTAVVKSIEQLPGADDAPAVGLGVPGLVAKDGTVGPCPNLAGWDKPLAVAEPLSKRLGKPVYVANDVNCGAVAESFAGEGKGFADLLAVFVGTGVGGGLVLDGDLRVGARGMAGEIGHMTVHPGGRKCGCGGYGHLEVYAGRAGIEREARRRAAKKKKGSQSLLTELAGDSAIKSRHLLRGLEEGDEMTVSLLEEATEALAIAIGNLATTVDIERVVIGGGVADKLGQSFIDQIAASDSFGGFGSDVCELRLAGRIDDAGALGAALIAYRGDDN